MNNRRLYYRVILKLFAVIALSLLFWVFVNSLFTQEEKSNKEQAQPLLELDISEMQKGNIKKMRLGNREIAILFRELPVFNANNQASLYPPALLNSLSRSQKPEYFVYFNHGDSGNCPLFYSKDTFKDVCSGKLFDTTGREKNNAHGYKIKIPPHHFVDQQLYLGKWD